MPRQRVDQEREGAVLKKLMKWLRDPEITILSNDMLTPNERGRTRRYRYYSRVGKLALALEDKPLTFMQIFDILVEMKALPNTRGGQDRLSLLMDLGVPSGDGETYQFMHEGENEHGASVFRFTRKYNTRL